MVRRVWVWPVLGGAMRVFDDLDDMAGLFAAGSRRAIFEDGIGQLHDIGIQMAFFMRQMRSPQIGLRR